MKVNPNIFKVYDIRGKYPSEVNEEIAKRVGNAVVQHLSQKLHKKRLKILVCRDVRKSSSSLRDALVKGAVWTGAEIIDVGIGTTPYFYFLMRHLKPDGGIMVTASHNPAEYNGFKIRERGGKPIGAGTGLEKIRSLASKSFKGRLDNLEVINYENHEDSYLNFIAKGITIKNPIKAVVDAAGGSTAYFLPRLLNKFPNLIYKPLFFEPDGTFKTHPPNPLLPESQRFVKEELKRGQFRFGAIFDGDGDRVLFFDENGGLVRSEYILGLLAEEKLKKYPDRQFVLPVNTSKGVREYLGEKGAKIQLTKVGYAFMAPAMIKKKAEYGAEVSGHFYFRSFFYNDSALLALLKLASLLSRTHRSLSQLVRPFERYISSGEINFQVKDKKAVLRRIKGFYSKRPGREHLPGRPKYAGPKISLLDGITVEYPDWWFNIRPSNTEPLMRIVVEAKGKQLYEEKLKEVEKLIKG